MWNSLTAVFRKEFLHIIRDRGTLRIAILMPVMQILLFGFIDQTVHDVATVVVDQDRSVESRLFLAQLRATGTFLVTSMTTSPDEAREQIRSGRARVGVIIPPKFHNHRVRGEPAQVLVLIDGSEATMSAQALASVNGLAAQDNNHGRAGGLAVQPVILFNPENRTPNYLIPGLIAVLMFFISVALASGAIVREREQGTFEQLLVTPVNPLGLMLGKLGPYLLVGITEMTLVLLIMRFAFSVPIHGSLLLLYAMALVYLFAMLALGLLISTRAHTQTEAFQLTQMIALPSIFLSGYIFPFEGLPTFLKGVGLLLPPTHMIAVMRGVVLREANVIELWPHIVALVVMCFVLLVLAARSIRKVAA